MIKETIKIIGIILLIYFITIGIVTTITTISDLWDLYEYGARWSLEFYQGSPMIKMNAKW